MNSRHVFLSGAIGLVVFGMMGLVRLMAAGAADTAFTYRGRSRLHSSR